eukprot:TRINITY_DN4079_c0_g1_i2.p1 TRINITY_DN4079_c0_g1~~TRINITY_DN4079_c0_g1_i2.p1  ORF type:complete len:191 (+),score=39.13 TRINITY_DN4079_c0_g1_i2:188-760(+)
MLKTDRGLYTKEKHEAYNDHPSPIGWGATISAPHMHAQCLEMLLPYLKNAKRVLDVGSGSGYLSACMARMIPPDGKVYGIDVIKELVDQSLENVRTDDPELLDSGRIILKVGDGWEGVPEVAPFDLIHVGAAAARVPEKLVEQLKNGGRMVVPVGTHDQNLVSIEKDQEGKVTQQIIFGVRYVPLIENIK